MNICDWTGVASWVWNGLGLLGVMPALMSPMMFATERATKRYSTLLLFASVVSFPIVCWLAVSFGEGTCARGDARMALYLMCAPLVNLALGAAASAWIGIVHGGSLGGA